MSILKTLTALFLLATIAFQTNVQANQTLESILSAQSDEHKQRHTFRHPQAALEFFEVKPGTTVMEILPGGGWYSKILLPYLGKEGQLIGVDYALEMWSEFGSVDEAFINKKKLWTKTWVEKASTWRNEDSATLAATTFGEPSEQYQDSVDTVLFIRALHGLARFEDKGAYLSQALNKAYAALKPGGVLGIIQHEARADRPDDWADGSNGYLKKEFVIEFVRNTGFEYIEQSDINENPKDLADEGDFVWRLPPALDVPDEDADLKTKMLEIGESNRMTLKFRKPNPATVSKP